MRRERNTVEKNVLNKSRNKKKKLRESKRRRRRDKYMNSMLGR